MKEKRIVVTGYGLCTPLGTDSQTYWGNRISGKGSIRNISEDHSIYGRIKTRIASKFTDDEIKTLEERLTPDALGYNPDNKDEMSEYRGIFRSIPLNVIFSALSTFEAVNMSGIFNGDDSRLVKSKTGSAIGSGFGGQTLLEKAGFKMIEKPEGIINVRPSNISAVSLPGASAALPYLFFGLNYDNPVSISSACTSGIVNPIHGIDQIRYKDAIAYIVGGTQELSFVPVGGFTSAGALSRNNDDPEHASRPYDRDRDGFVMGEGAGILLIEELGHALDRGARIYAEIAGYGKTSDGMSHPTKPNPEGTYASLAMKLALVDAGISPDEINYINSHGTSTEYNDIAETLAIKKVFGENTQVPVTTAKGSIGHGLNASGGIELVETILAVQNNMVPLTKNLENPDIANGCTLNYGQGQSFDHLINYAMCTAFGFNGRNAVIVLKKYND